MVYQYLSEVITPQSHWKVVGVVFDSLPSQRCPMVGARAAMASSQANVVFKYMTGLFVIVYLYSTEVLSRLWGSNTGRMYWDFMHSEAPKWPSLYLYSRADEITNYHYVEEVITNRRRLGADVAAVFWDDSEHVSHFRKHPEAYINQCQKFLDYCLRKANYKDYTLGICQEPFGQTAV